MSSPLAFTDAQLNELRLAAATVPPAQRSDLLKLIAGFLEFEGDFNDASFSRALNWALSALPAVNGPSVGQRLSEVR